MLRGERQIESAQTGTAVAQQASLVWPVLGDVASTVLSALQAASQLGTGELVTDSSAGGRIFLHDGHVAWVVAGDDRSRLTDVLQRRTNISADDVAEVYRLCQLVGRNFAELLVERGLATKEAVRAALLEHNANQLNRLLRAPMTSLQFTPVRRRYASDLLFQVDELISFVPPGGDTMGDVLVLVPSLSPASPPPLQQKRPMSPTSTLSGEHSMSNIKTSLDELMTLDGAIAGAIVDWESGLTLGTIGGGPNFDVELAASGNTSVVKAKMTVMRALGIKGGIEDFLITLADQYHLIRPLSSNTSLFVYVVIDKSRGNLGLARHKVRQIESALKL